MTIGTPAAFVLDPAAWPELRYHATQHEFWLSVARFIVVAAGRRSGKTTIGLRKLIRRALAFTAAPDGNFLCAAPTREQAKRLFWRRIKRMVPRALVAAVSESELFIQLVTGHRIRVVGLEESRRVEGEWIDGILCDEFDEVKWEAWTSSIRPALSTVGRPPGWAILIGRPKGRRNIWRLFKEARDSKVPGEYATFKWASSEIIDAAENESARRMLDPRSYDQEYNANFVNFEGRIYYTFDASIHAHERLPYFKTEPISLCLDFNVKPGVAQIVQEQRYWGTRPNVAQVIDASIGEIWIPDDSNTQKVCEAFVYSWGTHAGEVHLHGDSTGGARGTSQTEGSDWDIARRILRKHFGDRLRDYVPRDNPFEKVRVNSVNSRLLSIDGTISWLVDGQKCPRLVEDFETVQGMSDGSGRIDKDPKKFAMYTHPTDAVGYRCATLHPLVDYTSGSEEF